MKKALGFKILMSLFCFFVMFAFCYAGMITQKNSLFKINIPQGWVWTQSDSDMLIKDPENKYAISIHYTPKVMTSTVEEENELLKKANQGIIDNFIKLANGNLKFEGPTKLSTINARRIDAELVLNKQRGIMTWISCFNKGYAFVIAFGGPGTSKQAEMEAAVATLEFQ